MCDAPKKLLVALPSYVPDEYPLFSEPSAMLRTYEGVLEDGRVRWTGNEEPAPDRPLRVHVTVLEEESTERQNRGQRMADALSKLADVGAFRAVDNPSEWQREIRQERPLPGRDR